MPMEKVTPHQAAMQFTEYVKRELREQAKPNIRGYRYMTHLSDEVLNGPEPSYYNQEKEHTHINGYDRLFNLNSDYENKLHRDDRASRLGLDVNAEERSRKIPVLSSSVYGRSAPIENAIRDHVRIESVYKGFYRPRGTGIPFGDSVQKTTFDSN